MPPERNRPVPPFKLSISSTHAAVEHQVFQLPMHVLLILFLLPMLAIAADASLQNTRDLHEDGLLADQLGIPILLLVSREQCSYCRRLKREVLGPIQLTGQYKDRVLMREILIDPGQRINDFQGHDRRTAELAAEYGVSLTPTLLFLDPKGQELSTRMVGINTLEMFSFYLDEAIVEASRALPRNSP